ncbi:uncharacterized protein LOC130655799 [Hydractinia symbiolongicarpus]|uniref:uncharacterized protein LOC130655799 n=1 Tax=Hydractinia symbiolongicarpus TaxID=13093 RepID=UPI00254A8508|nr:uncharacterized protein LOC130655799 [Hydractinia symbiolongicarpus]
MVGDINQNLKYSLASSFADDTQILKEINGLMDTFKLHCLINIIYKWTTENNMKLNGCKFEHLSYGKIEFLKPLSVYLSNTSEKINKKITVKDLGVIMSNDCKFNKHISNLISKANRITGWILRTFESREKNVMLTLWKSLVILHLDYCSQFWSPLMKGQIQDIEMVQRNFTRKILGTQRRREQYAIIYIWKVIAKIVPNFGQETGKGGITWYTNDRLGRKCVVPVVKKGPFYKTRCASLAVQGVRLFNGLPKAIRNLSDCSIDCFKSKLDCFLATVPDEPLIPNYVQFLKANTNSIIDMMSIGLAE